MFRCQVRQQLAEVYAAQGRANEAEAIWQQVLSEHPHFGPARLGLAELFLAQGRWAELDEAASKLENGLAAPREATLLRARSHLARREFGPARQLLEAAVAREPRDVTPWVYLSQALLQEGSDVAAAERALQAVLERDPSQAESWANLAKLLRNQGRLPEAAEVCRQGRTRCPWDADVVLLHGLALQDLGDFRGAETSLLEVLERDASGPSLAEPARVRSATARHHLALLYRAQRPADAEAQWRAALQLKPESVSAWLGLGELFRDAGRWPELEEAANRLEAMPGGVLEATVLRARGHLARKEFAEARRLLEVLLEQEPRAEWPLVILSYVLLQEGKDLIAAEQVLRQVLEVSPGNMEARRNLDILLRQHGLFSHSGHRTAEVGLAGPPSERTLLPGPPAFSGGTAAWS